MAIANAADVVGVEADGFEGGAHSGPGAAPSTAPDASCASRSSHEHAAHRAGSQPAAALTPLAGIRVLVVEDDADLRELTAAILSHAGASVDCAVSAITGLERFIEFAPQLVVSDIAMPEVDGYALVGQIRSLGSSAASTPCVALTAFDTDEDRRKALRAGFSLHLAKPIEPVVLVAALTALLKAAGDSRRADEAARQAAV
jgi:CheY-like chemotaxis protein